MVHSFDNDCPIEPRYPVGLLKASDQERLAYFSRRDLIISHPEMECVIDATISATDPGLDQNLVLLVGPSGVGKTAVTKIAVSRINKRHFAANPDDNNSVPAIWLEADAPEKGNFDYKPFYIEALQQLQVPLVGKSLPVETRCTPGGSLKTIVPQSIGREPSTSTLRTRARESLAQRNTELVAIDEAVNLLHVRSYRTDRERRGKFAANANTLRSLVNKSPAILLLSGAFDLFDLMDLSGQLTRRRNVIYFPEYSESDEGLAGFSEGFIGLLSHLPVLLKVDVARTLRLCFEQSVGTIGIARVILHRWLKRSLETGEPLTEKLLMKCFFPKASLSKLREEAKFGRRMVKELLETSHEDQSPEPTAAGEHAKRAPRIKPGQTSPDRRWKADPPTA